MRLVAAPAEVNLQLRRVNSAASVPSENRDVEAPRGVAVDGHATDA